MTWLLLNIPLAVLFFALWVGVPMWLVLKRPDRGPARTVAPALTRLPVSTRTLTTAASRSPPCGAVPAARKAMKMWPSGPQSSALAPL
jgi:hypothetical protein